MQRRSCERAVNENDQSHHKKSPSDKDGLSFAVIYAMVLNLFKSWKALIREVYFRIIFPFLTPKIFGFVYFISINPETML